MAQKILSLLSIFLMGAVIARADRFVSLDFSGLQIGEEVLGYYDGGFGSFGSGPGPDLGITFTDGFVTEPVPPDVSFPQTNWVQLMSTSGVMDALPKLSGLFSCLYANSGSDGTVNLYSGLDGSGRLVGTIALPTSTENAVGADEDLSFKSAVFTGTGGALEFAIISVGDAELIPEPSSMTFLLTALLAVWWCGRKRALRCLDLLRKTERQEWG